MKTETYKLHIGFRKLGKFKQFARDSGLSGTFSLIGDGYRDSLYISKSKVGEQRRPINVLQRNKKG